MQVKLKKISTKSSILIFSIINVIAGFILGALVTIVSLMAPEQEGAAFGAWAILIFPIVNGLLGIVTAAFLTGLYNFIAPRMGGIQLDFDPVQ